MDANIVRKSVELASVAATDRVVEIGPGLGTLTRALLSTGAQVWAIEHDPRLAAYLRTDVMPDAGGRLHLMEGDALDAPRAGLATNEAAAGFKVVANLPYAISTPWMDSMLADPLPQHMVLMLQREAADRYAAAPGSKQFGAISIFLQSAFDIAPGHKVPAACFHPRPDIESYLLNLVRKPVPYLFSPETKRLIRACFQQRRKQVSSLLRGKLPDDGQSWISTLTLEGLDGRARPEAIPTKAWQRLSVT
ncbi:16S rRNA (adenine(1518)-N(6)/adenine(1519)-N(6))-dimethyltransferase RsmA [Opitutaceae bacterium LMO-CP1]|uniref:16S rRNA (adenine(1518)-N(6)/adenine(1519)-N(6))- dimethyltransferase RsmA n=1 Tax=Synoicihabitans lomoniglobus TaxID=2909285 RepID=UPI003030816E|nr:16S rRNA (adenine(1518)-N(6)/adenine(1519)-N(6))-dimethyltransferase RsmA [Opitutaceae bacterium LMO-M01]